MDVALNAAGGVLIKFAPTEANKRYLYGIAIPKYCSTTLLPDDYILILTHSTLLSSIFTIVIIRRSGIILPRSEDRD